MSFLASVLRVLDTGMTTPKPYGWFHLLWFVLWVAAAIAVSVLHKKHPTNQRKVVFWITVAVVILEIYKQTGKNKTQQEIESRQKGVKYDYEVYAINWERELLYERINKKFKGKTQLFSKLFGNLFRSFKTNVHKI